MTNSEGQAFDEARVQAAGVILVQRMMCKTCIYRPHMHFDIEQLENEVRKDGGFSGYRVCHHAPERDKVCCAGFWRRHKDKFLLGQLAQRLRLVRFGRWA